MSRREECAECEDRDRCGAWFLMRHLMWIDEVTMRDNVLTVKHSYPEGVNVLEDIRELLGGKSIDMAVELRVVREEPCEQ
jgi:hypothetical protein